MNSTKSTWGKKVPAAIGCLLSTCYMLHSAPLPKINISIAQDSIDILEAAPFADVDVHGNFTVNDTSHFNNVEIHYRGAYNLWSLMRDPDIKQRNWKVKFPKDYKYRNRREWNFNYDQHLRQKIAYDLFKQAGVAAPSARHVILNINDERHGLYLEYEDPDNKDWLRDNFGDQTGDLYKAGFDMPDTPSYFALLTDLGDSSSNYFMHYSKKTNNDSIDSLDYSPLVRFIKVINHTSQESFPDSLKKHFNIQSFIRYLVIANFINHWDSYPTRPKNYWLYHNPSDNRWNFIPWDLDGTFQKKTTGSVTLDTNLSIFYQLLDYEPYKGQPNEGTERPLTRRMFQYAEFKNAYLNEYHSAIKSYLNAPLLIKLVDSLATETSQSLNENEKITFNKTINPMKVFITSRFDNVKKQLETSNADRIPIRKSSSPAPYFSIGVQRQPKSVFSTVSFLIPHSGRVRITLADVKGRTESVVDQYSPAGEQTVTIAPKNRASGVYFMVAEFDGQITIEKFLIK